MEIFTRCDNMDAGIICKEYLYCNLCGERKYIESAKSWLGYIGTGLEVCRICDRKKKHFVTIVIENMLKMILFIVHRKREHIGWLRCNAKVMIMIMFIQKCLNHIDFMAIIDFVESIILYVYIISVYNGKLQKER